MRKEYFERQKREHGRKVVISLPIHYPKEVLTALDILSVELWGPPGEVLSHQAGRIQTYVCPLVRKALAFIAGGFASDADALLFPHTCDSIQGLASLIPDFGGWDGPVLRFIHPKGERRASAEAYVASELDDFIGQAEKLAGKKLEPARLSAAVKLHVEIDELRRKIIEKRRNIDMRDSELYAVLRRGEWLWPEDHLAELKTVTAKIADKPQKQGVALMLSGIVPEPMDIFEALENAGAYVVADDYAAIGRRIPAPVAKLPDDPKLALIESYFALPPCSTRSSDLAGRVEYLAALYARSGAAGLVLHNIKFCEPEMFDVAMIKKRFAAMNAPLLYMETELEKQLSGQLSTRLEAFVEMASKGGAAK